MNEILESFFSILKVIFNELKFFLVDTILDPLFNRRNNTNNFYESYTFWLILLVILGLIYFLLKIY